ncbi:MAG: hypothetical protein ACXAEU_07155 [Candidatus Hodarchaeales archaeon]|jgi:hypothetical protein
MKSYNIDQLKFHDGRAHSIDKERLSAFEMRALSERYYSGQYTDTISVLEDLGPLSLLYSNVQPWSEEIPDIDSRSARLFTIWAEDMKTKDVVTIIRGFYVLTPFKWGKETILDYYFLREDVPFYPIAIVSSFLTIFNDKQQLIDLVDSIKNEIQKNWHELRIRIINTLDKTDLWKRYVLSFDKIIYFSFMCSSFDRELVEAFRDQNYRITGVLQMLASPTPSYDNAMISTHLEEAKKTIEDAEKREVIRK